MNTIEECFKENGSIFPFRVYGPNYTTKYFHCVGRSPTGVWVGWSSIGNCYGWDGFSPVWQLYIEPKPKLKVWEWLIEDEITNTISSLLLTERQAHERFPCAKLTKLREFEVDL